MGAWIGLKQFQVFKNQINGFLGIGSAPEFFRKIDVEKIYQKMKAETIKKAFII